MKPSPLVTSTHQIEISANTIHTIIIIPPNTSVRILTLLALIKHDGDAKAQGLGVQGLKLVVDQTQIDIVTGQHCRLYIASMGFFSLGLSIDCLGMCLGGIKVPFVV